MKFIKTFENHSYDDLISELNSIFLDLKYAGFNVKIEEDVDAIWIEIRDFTRGYLSSFNAKDLVETAERLMRFLPTKEIRIFTHKQHHSQRYEELKIQDEELVDLENKKLEYPMYYIDISVSKQNVNSEYK